MIYLMRLIRAVGIATIFLSLSAPAFAAPPTPWPESDDEWTPTRPHWVSVDLSDQMLIAYEGNTAVRVFIVSTGDAAHPTLTGRYDIDAKYDQIDVIGKDYYFRDVPYYMQYFYGFALHAATWHNDFGRPVSRGCVNLKLEDAKWLYNFLAVGDFVYIHK